MGGRDGTKGSSIHRRNILMAKTFGDERFQADMLGAIATENSVNPSFIPLNMQDVNFFTCRPNTYVHETSLENVKMSTLSPNRILQINRIVHFNDSFNHRCIYLAFPSAPERSFASQYCHFVQDSNFEKGI